MDASYFSFRFSKQSRNSSSKPKGRNRSLLNETLESRQLLAADLWISEFMASNSETLATDDREYHDWVEIHNPSGEAVSLEGWYLTDDSNELDKWQFPAVELPANGFRVVHASNLDKFDVEEDEIHTNFRLASEGDYLALVRPDSSVAHAYSPAYPDQRTDVSYGPLFGADGIQIGDNYYFETPTPGEANGPSVIRSIVEQVDVDVPRGYYDEPFDVNLSVGTPGATIKYTTDGTWPTADNGIVAEGPVTISTTTTLRVGAFAENMLDSDTNTQTYIFLDDVIHNQTGEGLPEEWGYFDDQGPRRPARAKANYGTDPDIANHEDYKDTLRDDLRAVPTVSLVVDPEDLWPLETGIYSNSERKGDNWERQVSAEWMNVDGETEWATNAGIRIHGGWARRPSQTLKFSFKVIFRGEYGDSNLVHPVFGEDGQQEFQTIIMRGGFNDSWRSTNNSSNTYTQDQWSRATQREMGGNTSRDRYVHLYLNGMYWGMYSATERMNAEWASAYMGGEPEEWDVINTGGNVIDGNSRAFNDLMRLASDDDTTYEELAAAIEIDDYIDYMLVNQYVGNWDWPHNNWYMSRHRVEGAKWQFHTWDAEGAFQRPGEDRVHFPDGRNEVGPQRVYYAMVKHPEFQERYAELAYEHLFNDGALTPEAGVERLREIAAGMDRAIVGESLRWGDGKDDSGRPLNRENWTRRIESIIRTYFPRRGDQYIGQLRTVAAPLAGPLYSLIDAPTYSQFGGKVSPDFDVNITTDLVGGTVYYTTDGTDPRADDGSVSESAIRLTSDQLVEPNSPAKVLVPTGAANEANWQSPDFDDAGWIDAKATIGYETGTIDDAMAVPGGFTVTQYNFPERPDSLADIDAWLAAGEADSETTINAPYLNFLDGRRGGNFSDNDLSFPDGGNNFATKSTGTISVKDAGEYTFIITSNDAARLTIDGNIVHNDEERHGTQDAFVTMTLAAGDHPVEMLHFDRSGTGVLEFAFSKGTKTEHDDSFQLVGDGGHRDFTPLIQSDLKDELLNKSATAYVRIPFNIDDPDNIGNLLLRPQYGDGFAAYINGSLVASANAPDELSHESVAMADRFDADAVTFELFDISEHKSLLQAGENVLAIQALNNSADDLDMLFSPDLFMTLAEAPVSFAESTDINARVFLNGEWSLNTKTTFRVSDPATSDNLRVSEVNYHPSSATAAEIAAGYTDADDFEFIELVNVSDKAVDLSNVSLSQIVVQQNTEGVEFSFADSGVVELAPGEHVLVVEDIDAFEMRYGTGLPVAGQWNGALSNVSETISLVAGDSVVQRFEYEDTWHKLTDGGGATLEVYSPESRVAGDWSNAATWRSSVSGGTPGSAGAVMAGDSNGDGVFDTSDLLLVFQAGEYEDAVAGNSTFAEGDWNGDGDFTTRDIVMAFMQGNYRGGEVEQPIAAVPARADLASSFGGRDFDDDDDRKKARFAEEELHDSVFGAWVL